jgi:hypothetical protein
MPDTAEAHLAIFLNHGWTRIARIKDPFAFIGVYSRFIIVFSLRIEASQTVPGSGLMSIKSRPEVTEPTEEFLAVDQAPDAGLKLGFAKTK